MSNTRRLGAPADIRLFYSKYKCPDCRARAGRVRRADDGGWWADVAHEAHCPVLRGDTDDRHAVSDAVRGTLDFVAGTGMARGAGYELTATSHLPEVHP